MSKIKSWLITWMSGKPHEIIGPASDPMMYRWDILPRIAHIPRVYLHKFVRSDDDRALHDHPWSFCSFILKGGYEEVRRVNNQIEIHPRKPGTFAYRPAETQHIVLLHADMVTGKPIPSWSIVVTTHKLREWGFWCKEKFVHHSDWGSGGCGDGTA